MSETLCDFDPIELLESRQSRSDSTIDPSISSESREFFSPLLSLTIDVLVVSSDIHFYPCGVEELLRETLPDILSRDDISWEELFLLIAGIRELDHMLDSVDISRFSIDFIDRTSDRCGHLIVRETRLEVRLTEESSYDSRPDPTLIERK